VFLILTAPAFLFVSSFFKECKTNAERCSIACDPNTWKAGILHVNQINSVLNIGSKRGSKVIAAIGKGACGRWDVNGVANMLKKFGANMLHQTSRPAPILNLLNVAHRNKLDSVS
jgi:hypothetical protein